MKLRFFAVVLLLPWSGVALAGPHLAPVKEVTQTVSAKQVQFTRGGSRSFRSCMRAKYGPRYFYRVRQAQRYFMAQACGG